MRKKPSPTGKLILPQKVIDRINQICPIQIKHRTIVNSNDLLQALIGFREKKHNGLREYAPDDFVKKYCDGDAPGLDTKTLKSALSREGKKDDGASESLRNLISYYCYSKSWEEALERDIGMTEAEVIVETDRLRKEYAEKQKQNSTGGSYLTQVNVEVVPLERFFISKHVSRYRISQGRLTCCCFNAAGDELVISGFDYTVYLVSIHRSKLFSLTIENSIARVVRPLTEDIVLIGFDSGNIVAFHCEALSFKKVAHIGSPVYSIDVAALTSGLRLLTGDRKGEVIEWEIANPKALNEGAFPELNLLRVVHHHTQPAFQVTYVDALCRYSSVGADGNLMTLDTTEQKITTESLMPGPLYSLAASEKVMYAGGTGGLLIVANSEGGRTVIKTHEDTVRSLRLSKNGKWLFSGSKDRTVKLWDSQKFVSWILSRSDDYVYELTLSNMGEKLAVVDGAGVLTVIDFQKPVDDYSFDEMQQLISEMKKHNQ